MYILKVERILTPTQNTIEEPFLFYLNLFLYFLFPNPKNKKIRNLIFFKGFFNIIIIIMSKASYGSLSQSFKRPHITDTGTEQISCCESVSPEWFLPPFVLLLGGMYTLTTLRDFTAAGCRYLFMMIPFPNRKGKYRGNLKLCFLILAIFLFVHFHPALLMSFSD